MAWTKKKIYELTWHSTISDSDVLPISATASWDAEKSTASELASYVKTTNNSFDTSANTLDDITDGSTYVKMTTTEKTKLETVATWQASSIDNAIVRFNGTDWKTLQNWSPIINDDDSITLTWVSAPTHVEGKFFYDSDKKAISYYNDEVDVTVNCWQEIVIPVYNDTWVTITNWQVVYPAWIHVWSWLTSIWLADASLKSKSRLVWVATHDIENWTRWYVTKIGSVSNVNTLWLSWVLYLSHTTPWAFTMTKPDDGWYIVVIGAVWVASATVWTIVVDPVSADLTVEVTDTNGFPTDQRTWTTISFVDATRTFQIAPVSTDFHYYMLWDKYEKTASETVVIDNITWWHIVYYDGETLSSISDPSSSEALNIVLNKCIVSYIYWNSTDWAGIIIQDERHWIGMSPATHGYLHKTQWAKYLSWLALWDIIIWNGALDSHAQFSTSTWQITDEDLESTLNAVVSTTWLKYYYRTWADWDFSIWTNAWYSFPVWATPLPQFNEWTWTTWQITEIWSWNYMNIHIFANGDINWDPIVLVWTWEYSTVALASAWQPNELTNILATLPLPEFVLLSSVIIEWKTSLTNSIQSRIVQNTSWSDYTDWRKTELSWWAAPSNHNNLAWLDLAQTSVTRWHINDQAQTLAWIKTFGSFAITPSSVPTTDYQIANKKYVDDQTTAGSPLTTKWDIYTYGTSNARLPIWVNWQLLMADSLETTWIKRANVSWTWDVIWPATAIDSAIALFDSTTGKLLKDSTVTLPTWPLVGTTDTQTLTNKTLTSPVVNTPTWIVKGDVWLWNVDNIADANQTDLGTVTTWTRQATAIADGYISSASTWNSKIANVVEDTTPQLGGELDSQAHSIGFTLQTATGDWTTTFDFKLWNKIKFTFWAFNETFTFTAPSKPWAFHLILVQDGTGSRTVTRPTMKRPGGTAPTLTTTANSIDIVSLLRDGTNRYWQTGLNFS